MFRFITTVDSIWQSLPTAIVLIPGALCFLCCVCPCNTNHSYSYNTPNSTHTFPASFIPIQPYVSNSPLFKPPLPPPPYTSHKHTQTPTSVSTTPSSPPSQSHLHSPKSTPHFPHSHN